MRGRNPKIEIVATACALRAALFSALFVVALVPSASGQGAEAVTWARANTCASIRAYLSQYPGGRYVSEARTALRAKNCPDPEAEARSRAEREAADRVRLENETRDLRDRLAREEAARRAAETRAADEARKRVAAETAANAAKQKALPPATATSTTTAFDENRLHPDVRQAAVAARNAAVRAGTAALNARTAASTARSNGIQLPSNGVGSYLPVAAGFAGDAYRGTFAQGKYNGPGVYSFANNTNNVNKADRIEGDFVENAPHGFGLSYWHSGQRYSGEIRSWKRNGYGIQYFPDGSRYEGAWSADQRSGYGIAWSPSGQVSASGIWTNSVLTTSLTR